MMHYDEDYAKERRRRGILSILNGLAGVGLMLWAWLFGAINPDLTASEKVGALIFLVPLAVCFGFSVIFFTFDLIKLRRELKREKLKGKRCYPNPSHGRHR